MAAQVERKNPRLVKVGDSVQIHGRRTTEVVRKVSIVLHLSNGIEDVYDATTDLVGIAIPEEPDWTEQEVLASVEASKQAIEEQEKGNG